ncbi:hypothetical protein ACFQ1S_32670, partial [Kibdelosporangium lantanae]
VGGGMNPVHAGPRLTWQRLVVSVATMGTFLWLSAVQLTGWGHLGVFLVAEFVLYQAFSKLVKKRRRDLALLRCFGASRGLAFLFFLFSSFAGGMFAFNWFWPFVPPTRKRQPTASEGTA